MKHDKIYALFLYYGDGYMVPNNFLCLRYGSPFEIHRWLLFDGYLNEVCQLAMMMGPSSDRENVEKIMEFSSIDDPTKEDIAKLDIKMPSCCTCLAVADSPEELAMLYKTLIEYIGYDTVDTVMKGEELQELLDIVKESAESDENYGILANNLPERYI